ncbi:MAG: DUF4845 domain-containing protein [Thalassolituus sp.]
MHTHQKGLTTATALLVLLLAIVLLRGLMVIVPMYFDDTEVGIILDNMAESKRVDARSPDKAIVTELERRLRDNNLTHISATGLKTVRDRKSLTINWTYENRSHFLANIDFVMTFERQKVITSE